MADSVLLFNLSPSEGAINIFIGLKDLIWLLLSQVTSYVGGWEDRDGSKDECLKIKKLQLRCCIMSMFDILGKYQGGQGLQHQRTKNFFFTNYGTNLSSETYWNCGYQNCPDNKGQFVNVPIGYSDKSPYVYIVQAIMVHYKASTKVQLLKAKALEERHDRPLSC